MKNIKENGREGCLVGSRRERGGRKMMDYDSGHAVFGELKRSKIKKVKSNCKNIILNRMEHKQKNHTPTTLHEMI